MPLTLQNTVNWTAPFVRLQPLTGVGGIPTEPAVTIANTVKQLVLSPPFAWRWNRNTVSINLVAGTQDYVQSMPDFGWVEKAMPRPPFLVATL